MIIVSDIQGEWRPTGLSTYSAQTVRWFDNLESDIHLCF